MGGGEGGRGGGGAETGILGTKKTGSDIASKHARKHEARPPQMKVEEKTGGTVFACVVHCLICC